jgi:hypothetical protein
VGGVSGVNLQNGVFTTDTTAAYAPNGLRAGDSFTPTNGQLISGKISRDYSPTSGTWTAESTLLLNALNYSTIAFHDSGARVDFIRAGAGVIDVGYDGGFGGATVRVPNAFGVGMLPPDNNYNRLSVYGGFNATSAWAGYSMESRDNSAQTWVAYANASNYRIFSSTAGGDIIRFDTSGVANKLSAGTAWVSFSDARVKDVKGEYEGGLAEVLQMRPVVYDYNGKAGTIPNGRRNAGIIAQEIREIMPDTVTQDAETGMLMFDATEVTWALVNAVKELKQELDILRVKV